MYEWLSVVSTFLVDIEDNYHVPEKHFNICPPEINKSHQILFSNVVRRKTVQELLLRIHGLFSDNLCYEDLSIPQSN